jgi:hypothetical protein
LAIPCTLQYALTAYAAAFLPFPDDVLAFVNGMVDTIDKAMPEGNFGVYPGYVEYVHHYTSAALTCYLLPSLSSPLIPKSKWPTQYWGKNYPRLLKIKEKYDPNNVFSNPQSVGSDLVSREGAESGVSLSPVGVTNGAT